MFKVINVLAYTAIGSAFAGKCPFGFDNDKRELAEDKRQLQDVTYPSEIFTCPADKVKVQKTPSLTWT